MGGFEISTTPVVIEDRSSARMVAALRRGLSVRITSGRMTSIASSRAPRGWDNFFPLEQFALRSIPVNLLAGCVYVSLSEHAPDFRPFAQVVEPTLRRFHFDT